jgi:hypothetical protein
MRRPLFWIAIFGSWLSSVCAEPLKPLVAIEFPKSYAEGTLPHQGFWLGLYCNESDCEIRNAAVKVTSSSAKNVLDEDEAIDILDIDDRPFALFYGTTLKPGKVVTWFKAGNSPYGTRSFTQLQRLGRWQMPWGITPLTISWVKLPEYGGFRYHLGDGKAKQFLFATSLESHYGGDTTPFVRWVGDLDGDGKIDLLLTLPDDNCGYDERLYLSSLATGQEFIRKAAQLSGREAACGC